MSKIIIPILFTLQIFLIVLHSQVIRVPADYPTIQEGINAAVNGDTVLVFEGEYFENIRFRGKNIIVGSEYIIDGNLEHIPSTIINGSQSADIDTGSCVIFGPGEDSTAVIEGFTITGGTGTSYAFGGGTANFREGGGIILHNSSATIKQNIIHGNIAEVVSGVQGGGGGGISSMYGNPKILNNIIADNIATYAAGIVLNWSGGVIRNNIITENTGGGQYGTAGLMIWQSPPWSAVVENNTIVQNHSTSTAGGLSVEQTSAIIRNNIIWGNTQQSGPQVSGYFNSTFEYCNTEEQYPGNGNLSVQPEFKNDLFELHDLSPCIDAGNPDPQFNDKDDPQNPGFALNPSMGNLINDIGAYGGAGAAFLPDYRQLINNVSEKKTENPETIMLHQNYPNPFNTGTNLRFTILERSFVKLEVYDLLGNHVSTLLDEELSPGFYKTYFNGSALSSGIYICKLLAGNYLLTNKMTLLK